MKATGGKIAGAMVGLVAGAMLGGPWAVLMALAGFGLGSIFDAMNDPDDPLRKDPQSSAAEIDHEARRLFARHLASLLFKIARADGPATAQEIAQVDRYFSERLGFDSPEDRAAVDAAFAAAEKDEGSLESAASACKLAMGLAERMLLICALYELALADGKVSSLEAAAILNAARLLEIPPEDVASLRRSYVKEESRAYEVLGLTGDATAEEIKKAFRALASRHHPDKVAHLGPRAVEVASGQFLEINQAYEAIRLERGL